MKFVRKGVHGYRDVTGMRLNIFKADSSNNNHRYDMVAYVYYLCDMPGLYTYEYVPFRYVTYVT
jgi:hypothetical protein